ncbi:MAG: phosphatase PAP2 family protein [Nanoarchaeota archaeon]|nr:phosphatase PAP2 family protein [Nanoarchaeota archaeon]
MNRDVKRKIYTLAIISFVFAIITVLIYHSGWDSIVHDYFSPVSESIFTTFMSYITLFGGREAIIALFLIVLSILLYNKKYDYILFYLISVSGATVVNYELKNLFQRVRPEIYGTEFAFPSGHTMASTVAFGALVLFLWPKNKRLAMSLLVFPILVGFSRVYLDVHWLSDVFGGFAFGSLWLMITFYLFFGWRK